MATVDPIRSKEDLKDFEEDLLNTNLKYATIWGLLTNFAMRVSDALDLKVKNVRKPDGSIREVFRDIEQKNKNPRRININDSAKKYLQMYFDEHDLDQEDWLFPSNRGGHISRKTASKYITEAAERIGIEDNINTHSGRKTFGYHAYVYHGYSALALKEKYGHKNIADTKKYIGAIDDEIEEMEREVNIGADF